MQQQQPPLNGVRLPPRPLLRCPVCPKPNNFTGEEPLRAHLAMMHYEDCRPYSCEKCSGARFYTENSLKRHLEDDHGEVQYKLAYEPDEQQRYQVELIEAQVRLAVSMSTQPQLGFEVLNSTRGVNLQPSVAMAARAIKRELPNTEAEEDTEVRPPARAPTSSSGSDSRDKRKQKGDTRDNTTGKKKQRKTNNTATTTETVVPRRARDVKPSVEELDAGLFARPTEPKGHKTVSASKKQSEAPQLQHLSAQQQQQQINTPSAAKHQQRQKTPPRKPQKQRAAMNPQREEALRRHAEKAATLARLHSTVPAVITRCNNNNNNESTRQANKKATCRECLERVPCTVTSMTHHTNAKHLKLVLYKCRSCSFTTTSYPTTGISQHVGKHHPGQSKDQIIVSMVEKNLPMLKKATARLFAKAALC